MSDKQKDDALLTRQLDAQEAVLGSILIQPDVVGIVLSRVQADDFTSKQYRTVFLAIQGLYKADKPIDPIVVRETLGSQYSDVLVYLMDITPTTANLDVYIDLLKQSALLYHMKDLGQGMADAKTLDEARSLLDKAVGMQVSRPGVQSMTMAEGFERFFDRHDGESKPKYLKWGVPVLDERLFAEAGDMVVIGGYPSDGKTALTLQFASGIAGEHCVGFFSYESTKDKLFDRIVANRAMMSYTKIKRNTLTEEDYQTLVALSDKLTSPQLTLIDAAGMTVLDIQAYSQAHHYDVVIIDYLQKIPLPRGQRLDEFARVTAVSSDLQQFGRQTQTTIIALSQLSRPERGKYSKIRAPIMSDLRSSGQIEQDADIIMFLYRENQDDKASNRILQIAKNKEGEALDKVRFAFDGDTQTFSRIAPGAEPTQKGKPSYPKQATLFPLDENPADFKNPWEN